MNKIAIIFTLLAFMQGTTKDFSKYELYPNEGIGDIVVGKSTLQDVQRVYGLKKVTKRWHKAMEVEFFRRYEYYLNYDSIGTFSTYTTKRNKNIISQIILSSDSKCRTILGVGIGSNYPNTIRDFGQPKQSYFQVENGKSKLKLIYEKMSVLMNGKDTLHNSVERIIIR